MILKNKYAERLTNVERGVDTDWLSKPLRTGVGQRHGVRLEGGDNAFRYAASLQYNDLKGVMKKSDRKSINGGITLSYYHKNVVFRNDLSIGVTNSKDSPYGSFSDYTQLNPYWKPYDDKGKIVKTGDLYYNNAPARDAAFDGNSIWCAVPQRNAVIRYSVSQQKIIMRMVMAAVRFIRMKAA